jgi:hypothetical protein
MTGDISKDWIVYVLFGGAIIWVAFMIFAGGKNNKPKPPMEKENDPKEFKK